MTALHDHSAPWHCSLDGCRKCDGKPTYPEWWSAVNARTVEPPPKYVHDYPRCARCDRTARYETPAHRGGPIGNWCDEHLPRAMLPLGHRLRLRKAKP